MALYITLAAGGAALATIAIIAAGVTFTLFSVGGQLVSSLIIDIVAPTKGVNISHYLIIGIVMTYAGVLAGGVSGSQTKRSQIL
jgi:transporter family-2 protein